MNKKVKNIFIILNILLATLIMIMDVFRCFVFGDLIYKNIALISVCILAIINFLASLMFFEKNNFIFNLLIFIGVLIGSAGDYLIGINFIVGAALFAVGHILYIIALYFISKFSWKEIIIAALIIATSMLIVFIPFIEYGDYVIVIIAYAVILSLMFAKCLSNFLFNSKTLMLNIFLALAGLLFYLSDLMLLLYVFKDANVIFDKLCLMLYYPAQILFAVSILISSFNLQNKNNNKTMMT